MEIMNSKGQAALADALYFLLIVSGLSTFLFFFAASYGNSVKQQVALQYRGEYATSALETMLYSSTPRISGETLENATEVDFLLAAIKEDFADNKQFDNTQKLIVNNVAGLMEPLSDTFNYMYYIYLPERQEFVFLMLYTSEWDLLASSSRKALDIAPGTSVVYLCKPSSLDKLDLLTTNVGTLYQADARMQLVELKETGGRGYNPVPAQINLTMWTSTALPRTFDTELNCTCFKERKLKNPSCDPSRSICETEWKECS